jgi:dTDP-4-amino-4,6-dideoxygalactose transaminase
MAAMLADIKPGDEVIVPSYTFVSTAIAFVRQGAKIVFADSHPDHPGIDEASIEHLVTPRTKAIVPVHYAGVACDMDVIMDIAARHNLIVIEDAAQAVDSYYKGRPLGSIGHIGCFSFHETKNIQCGEGGMLCVNDERFAKRAEVLWEKGTNRAEFFRGEVNKYGWVDIGSSFLPADYVARRRTIWEVYHQHFSHHADYGQKMPHVPSFATNNGHMFYMVFPNIEKRSDFIAHYKAQQVNPVFHYLSLHKSPYYADKYTGPELPNADRYSDCLVRMPLFYELNVDDVIAVK